MITHLLSLAFGVGLYLVYEGLTNPGGTRSRAGRLPRVRQFLNRAGLREVGPIEFVVFSLGSGLALGGAGYLLLHWTGISLLLGLAGLVGPLAYYVHRHDRRRSALQAGLIDAISQLRDSIRAGLSVQEAMASLAATGPEGLRPEFANLAREMGLHGFAPALEAMRERLADPVFDMVSASLLLNEQVGGRNVSQVLDHLAQAARGEQRTQQEIHAYQARNVTSARIVAAVPLLLLVGIRAISPTYLAVFNGAGGQVLLATIFLSIAAGYLGMLWLTRLPGDARVLR